MSSQDVRSLINGAYSLKYQLMEQERLNRMKLDHHHTSRAVRERAHQLSKQTQQRRRALEEKKQAMAKAEEDRRRKALEERKRQQNEATNRFRAAVSRHSKPLKPYSSVPRLIDTLPVDIYLPTKPLKITTKSSTTEYPPQERVVLGREVEVPGTTLKKSPSLDDVLDVIRGDQPVVSQSHDCKHGSSTTIKDTSSPLETITLPSPCPLSPNHIQPVTNQSPYSDKMLFPVSTTADDNYTQSPIHSPTLEESSISSDSTLSLQDSLDSPDKERPCAEGQNDIKECDEIPKESLLDPHTYSSDEKIKQATETAEVEDSHTKQDVTVLTHDITQVETSFQKLNIQDNPTISGWESSYQSTSMNASAKKGILKKHSDSDISSDTSLSSSTIDDRVSKQSSAKHVRFLEDIHEQDAHAELRGVQSISTAFTPRMKISLANRGTFSQQVISSNIRRRSSKNGITIHIPQAMYDEEMKPQNGVSTQLLTLPVDKTVMSSDNIPTDNEINVLWSQISSYFHHKGIDSSEHLPNSKPVRNKRCQNTHQQPIKLWKRQPQIPQPVVSGHTRNNSGIYSEEEQRLMESIDLLNDRLKGRVTTNISPSPSNENRRQTHPITRSRSPSQLTCTRVRQHPKTHSLSNTRYY